MGLLKGWLYCYLWYSSILAGYAGLFCPILPLLLVSNKLYRYVTDALFTFWQYYPTVLLEVVCGCSVQVAGDPILAGETALLVMNHRTRTDWNFLWPALYHAVSGPGRYRHPAKFVLKDIIRHIPGAGWVMQLACFIYIRRCWLWDRGTLERAVRYFADMNYKYSLLLFPEGTDLTPATRAHSDAYADKHGLQKYEYVLHPRTTGFAFIAEELIKRKQLDAVYDMTLIYPDLVPQHERLLLNGCFPKEVQVHLTRYPVSVLPTSSSGLSAFLRGRWSDKERALTEHSMTGQPLHGRPLKRFHPIELYFALAFWTVLPYLVLYAFIAWRWLRHAIIAHTVLLLTVNLLMGGFQDLEVAVWDARRRWL